MTTAHRLSVSLLAFFLVAELTGVTLAQPGDLLVPLPPGYEQRRSNILGCADLPGGGGMYCGPTSSAILLKWIGENGYSNVGTWGESCCEVSDAIRDLGVAMSCSESGGTSTTDLRNALQDILDDPYPGQFDVGYFGRHSPCLWEQQYGRKFPSTVVHLNLGHLVIANIGWYDLACPTFPGKRCGGHYVAVTGYDVVDDREFWVRFRDPIHRNIACDVFSASATCSPRDDECIERWKTSLEVVDLQDTGDGCVNELVSASRWHWDRDEKSGDFCDVEGLGCVERLPYQDGFVYIHATEIFSRPDLGTASILSYDLAAGSTGTHSSGTAAIYTTVKKHPWLFELYHCQPGENNIFITDLETDAVGTLTTNVTINKPRRLEFGSDGTLYVLQNDPSGSALISAIDPAGGLVGQVAPGSLDDDIAYHEKLERVYAWDGANGSLQAYSTTLAPVGAPITLPSGPTYADPGYLAVDPTGEILYYNHDGDRVIFRFDLASGSALPSLSDTELTDPAEMALDNRGHVYVAQGSPAMVLEFDRSGNLVTNSAAAAFTANTNLDITRSSRIPLLDPYELNPQNLNVDSVDEEEDIPAVSEWGLVAMTLLVLTAGTLVYARRRAAQA